ncbi:TIGR03364 family FAD-dependent oxidoreductase [Mesorhizobium sp. CAU 1741]|uniref:TIGR03364 family FAD-dependent oxidoreductase n=1 Tax=Mesorhizobium sp. CAU 1741 TaxID=3140366 RepID=UPI00325AD956
MTYDLAVVGAGIVGLAHALAAAKRGLSVVVIDRDAQANGASIRNFGLVVVTGEEPGRQRRLAERSREIWLELAVSAGINILHRGLLVAAQRQEAVHLLEAFVTSPQGAGCSLLTAEEMHRRQPGLNPDGLRGGLFSPMEIRVESREAIPRIAAHLRDRWKVEFRFGCHVHAVGEGRLETSAGVIQARRSVICPGDDLVGLFPSVIAQHEVTRCKLQMLRLAPGGPSLGSAVVSDLSLIRYGGYSCLPEADALRARLLQDSPALLENGVHMIAVQSADGSLVVGDSHHYAQTPDPFGSGAVDDMILREFGRVFAMTTRVCARWTGTYASSPMHAHLRETLDDDARLVMITSGTGASTAFAIGEETIEDLFGN